MHPKHDKALADFDAYWDQRVRTIAEKTKPTGPQFHYTPDIKAVENIISKNVIWLGNSRQMNDKVELRYSLVLYRQEALKLIADRQMSERFLRYLARTNSRKVLKEFQFYSASFGVRDSAHMWKCYAGDGKGFSLGFAPRLFEPTQDRDATPLERSFYTGSVRYDESAIRDLHRESILKALDLMLGTSPDPRFQNHPEFARWLATHVLMDAVVTSITSKPNRWEPEQERRLYYPVGKDRKQLHKVHQLGDKTYLHHKVEHRDLVEVVAGMNSTEDERSRAQKALDDHGYSHIMVKQSAVVPRCAFDAAG